MSGLTIHLEHSPVTLLVPCVCLNLVFILQPPTSHAPAPRLIMRNNSLSLDSDQDSLLPACRESFKARRGRESYSHSTHSLLSVPRRT